MPPKSTRFLTNCLICGTSFETGPWIVKRGGGKYCTPSCYHEAQATFDPERFWQRVRKTDTCWIWEGAGHGDGYGIVVRNRKPTLTHRVSYELAHGPIPDGLFVCHHCDNPICVRPDHLFLGTQADNMADMAQKKRGRTHDRKGEQVPTSKLTAEQVVTIRSLVRDGHRDADIAKRFGVTASCVNDIKHRRTWSHLP